ncbi:hypothetical protein CDG81_19375 [Actinopolyspora erythraea]|uniref:Uncharacterized protein n=1 Tax=Actinopolyspora erythraea TaxID=414996 RepID=A0A099DA09_9ACTN|nr:hypothetical protein [Actinopolyspora erythraea]ASU80063.1 hypothetical protein CDG81_19375 [Actinopolyspora erythraea]KGI82205.1 hypothetical protein IL38_05515 [Actinopolyspora erythraea]
MPESTGGKDRSDEVSEVNRVAGETGPSHGESSEAEFEQPRQEVDSSGRPVLLTAGALGTLLALGATTIFGVVLADSTPWPPGSAGMPHRSGSASAITGSAALRVDLLLEHADPSGRGSDGSTGRPDPASGVPSSPAARSGVTGGLRPPSSSAGEEPSVGVVRDFCRLLGSEPARAMRLLSLSMTDVQRADVVRSWRGLRSVRSREVGLASGDRVVSTVAARDAAGSRIVLSYSFRVADEVNPLILSVRLDAARFHLPRK